MKTRLLLLFAVIILILLLPGAGCSRAPDFEEQVNDIVQPHRFGLAYWEAKSLLSSVRGSNAQPLVQTDNESELVVEYFTIAARINAVKTGFEASGQADKPPDELIELQNERDARESQVREILARQIGDVLAAEGIINPVDRYIESDFRFPPINFRLEQPPNLLVISPRDRIEYARAIILRPDMTLEQKLELEKQIDELGVSSLVVELGGLATYPSFVVDKFGLRFALDVVTEEWLHQYLFFHPLGLMYLLNLTGIARNDDIATINETVAGIVSKEIGAQVYKIHYAPQEEKAQPAPAPRPPGNFDFNREMRELRKTVDSLLGQGKTDEAEERMETTRQYLASHGYQLRKINQAYFAFYGTYADSLSSISPIGRDIKIIRERSSSLKSFLDTMSSLTTRKALEDAVARTE